MDLNEAKELCKSYQFLVGEYYRTKEIEAIIVAPADGTDFERIIARIIKHQDFEDILQKHTDFEVLVLSDIRRYNPPFAVNIKLTLPSY